MPLRGKDAHIRRLRSRSDQLVRGVLLEAYGRLARRTPVDKGRARANWNLAVGEPDRSEDPDATRSDFAGKQQEAVTRVAEFRPGDLGYVTNSVPYIGRLEDGYSGQAPEGMVKVTAAEMRQLVARVAAEVTAGGQ